MTLKELRVQNKKTAAEVAEVLGVGNSTIYGYEQGSRTLGLESILKLAKLYDVLAEEIIKAQLKSIDIRSTQ